MHHPSERLARAETVVRVRLSDLEIVVPHLSHAGQRKAVDAGKPKMDRRIVVKIAA